MRQSSAAMMLFLLCTVPFYHNQSQHEQSWWRAELVEVLGTFVRKAELLYYEEKVCSGSGFLGGMVLVNLQVISISHFTLIW